MFAPVGREGHVMNDITGNRPTPNMEVSNARLNCLIIGEPFFNQENEMIKECYKMNWL